MQQNDKTTRQRSSRKSASDSSFCYQCKCPLINCKHGKQDAHQNSKQWMFQNETQQTIFNPASNPSAAGHQGALRVQHRRLSNGSNHSSDNEPTEKEDDKTFAIYHWKCDMKKRSNSTSSANVHSPIYSGSPQQSASPTLQVPAIQVQPQQSPYVSRQEFDRLQARLEMVEQQYNTLTQNFVSLNQRYSELVAFMNQLVTQPQQESQQQQTQPQQQASNDMELQFDLEDDEIRKLIIDPKQNLLQQQQQQQQVFVRQSRQQTQFTVLNQQPQQNNGGGIMAALLQAQVVNGGGGAQHVVFQQY